MQGFSEIFDMLIAATSRVRELKLQREEYVCLKAMILLNSSEYTCVRVSLYSLYMDCVLSRKDMNVCVDWQCPSSQGAALLGTLCVTGACARCSGVL